MNKFMRCLILAGLFAFAVPLTGCESDDEPLDEVAEEAQEAVEETSEALDEAADEVEDAVDSVDSSSQ